MRASGPAKAPRFASVDALRGLTVAAMLLVNNPGDWGHVYAPLLHAGWHGCTPTDLVFPFFLIIVGVSIALGVVPRLEAGGSRGALMRTLAVRALRIVGLGLLLHLLAWWWLDMAHFRPWGVLQRIGLCFLAAGAVALWLAPRTQWLLLGGLLLGWWALLAWGGSVAPWDNFASRVDTSLLGPLLYQFDPATGRGHDPEGLLSTLGALATTLLGVRAGDWLRHGRRRALWIAALVSLLSGCCGRWSCPGTRTCGPRRTCCGAAAGRCWRWPRRMRWSTDGVGRRWATVSASMRSRRMPGRR